MRFLADMGVSPRIVEWLRRHVWERLETVLANTAPALERGAIVVVEESRHRIRSLP